MTPKTSKTCTGCGQDKPRDDFYVHPKGADNRMSKCKTCCIDADRIRTAKRRLAGANNSWSTPAEYAKRSVIPSFKYQPLELKPAPVRPGADDALKLPSRVGKNLHYRDGSAINLGEHREKIPCTACGLRYRSVCEKIIAQP